MKRKNWPRIRPRTRTSNGVVQTDYCIDCGMIDGRRRQEFRPTLEEAEGRAQEIRDEHDRVGAQAFALTQEQRSDAARAFSRLGDQSSLTEAVDYFLLHKGISVQNRTVSEVHSELLANAAKKGLRHTSIVDLRRQIRGFIEEHGKRPFSDVTHHDVEKWLDSQGGAPMSKLHRIRVLMTLFNYGVKRGYIGKSPVANIEKPKITQGMPEYLPVDSVVKLLSEADRHDHVMVPSLVLGFFAGIRSAELERLDWSSVSIENKLITIDGKTAKTNSIRHIEIMPNLLAWLFKYQKPSGKVGLKAKAFGIHLKNLREKAGIKEWPENGKRHTFATYHLAMWQDASKTAHQLGHTQGVQLLYRHYRGLATKSDAERYWAITPSNNAEKEVAEVSA